MAQKQDRWYEIDGDVLHVFNAPDPKQATGSSHTSVADLPYYRNNFRLRKVASPNSCAASSQQFELK